MCKVVISDDLEGQNEASVELLVLGKWRWCSLCHCETSRFIGAQEMWGEEGGLTCKFEPSAVAGGVIHTCCTSTHTHTLSR